MSRAREPIRLPAASQDTTVATEQSATVVSKFENLRNFNQNERSKSQYPEAPKAELRPEAVVASHLDQDEESFRRLAWEPTAEGKRL